jgi:tRNA(adenine34) deaminase
MSNLLMMREALEVARQGAARGEVPVGAIIAKDGVVLSRAHNLREQTSDPTAHAELVAIRAAAREIGDWRLLDTTLYVTLEPCPMCAGAVILARIPRVVYAASDSRSAAAGTLLNLSQYSPFKHKVDVTPGVLAEDSSCLLKSFFQNRRL